jgi:hypothetical protein
MKLKKCAFTRVTAKVPKDVTDTLTRYGEAGLSEEQNELLTRAAGINPWQPEAFAAVADRDAKIGPYGSVAEFIEASWPEAEAAGFTEADIAIGHRLDETGFEGIALAVVDAVARRMADTGQPGTVAIARVEYGIYARPDGDVTVTAVPLFDVDGDRGQMEATAAWLRREFRKRLAITATV